MITKSTSLPQAVVQQFDAKLLNCIPKVPDKPTGPRKYRRRAHNYFMRHSMFYMMRHYQEKGIVGAGQVCRFRRYPTLEETYLIAQYFILQAQSDALTRKRRDKYIRKSNPRLWTLIVWKKEDRAREEESTQTE